MQTRASFSQPQLNLLYLQNRSDRFGTFLFNCCKFRLCSCRVNFSSWGSLSCRRCSAKCQRTMIHRPNGRNHGQFLKETKDCRFRAVDSTEETTLDTKSGVHCRCLLQLTSLRSADKHCWMPEHWNNLRLYSLARSSIGSLTSSWVAKGQLFLSPLDCFAEIRGDEQSSFIKDRRSYFAQSWQLSLQHHYSICRSASQLLARVPSNRWLHQVKGLDALPSSWSDRTWTMSRQFQASQSAVFLDLSSRSVPCTHPAVEVEHVGLRVLVPHRRLVVQLDESLRRLGPEPLDDAVSVRQRAELDPAALGVHAGQDHGHPTRTLEAQHVCIVDHSGQLLALTRAVLEESTSGMYKRTTIQYEKSTIVQE